MPTKKNILVVIAARGGSKGVKDKNIRTIGGKPLIAYTVLQARRWAKTPYVICSTDSQKIAAVAAKYGAKIPFSRTADLAGDKAAKIDVIKDALKRCEKVYGKKFEIIVDLDVTSPIRRISDLNNCLKIFLKYFPKTLFSVVPARHNPYFNMVEVKGKTARLCKILPGRVISRQAAPKVYDMNASIYFYRRDYLLSRLPRVISDDSLIYIMDDVSRLDIDNVLDFKFIEFLIKEGVYKSEV